MSKLSSIVMVGVMVSVLLCTGISCSASCDGSVIVVDDEGDGDFVLIQDAVDAASPGDTIEVYSGTYYGRINISEQLFLRGICEEFGDGVDSGAPVLTSSEHVGAIVLVEADACEISGFFVNPGVPEGDEFGNNGIALHSKENIVCDNVLLTGNRGILAYVGKSQADCSGNHIHDNSLSGFLVAIQIEGEECIIEHNEIRENQFGIHIFDADDVEVVNNNFKENKMHGFVFWIPFSFNVYYPRPTGVNFNGNYYDNWIVPLPKPILRGFAPLLIPMAFSFLFDVSPSLEPIQFS